MKLAFPTGIWEVESNESYHADRTCESHSSLDCFRESAALFHARYVAKTSQRKPSPAMQLGSALNCLLLEPHLWQQQYTVAPEADKRTTKGKEAWAEFEMANGGKTILAAEDDARVRSMREAILAHQTGRMLAEAPGRNELAVRWQHGETGMGLKCKFDRLLQCGIGWDLKSTSDPSPAGWAKLASNLGYHRQQAHYEEGMQQALGLKREFYFLVVRSSEPYEVAVYQMDAESVQLGCIENEQTITALYRAYETDTWTNAWSVGVQEIKLPRWAFYQS